MASSTGSSFLAHFAPLRDPRQSWKVVYPVPERLLTVLSGTLAGAEDFMEIRRWAKLRLDFLRRFLPFASGIPSYGLPEGSFAAALVGKDGHVALRSAEPVTGADLGRTIDAVPMRRAGRRWARSAVRSDRRRPEDAGGGSGHGCRRTGRTG